MNKRHIFVTTALPYANGPLHLGFILEAIQADIWVRYQRLKGNTCLFICADDAHGTPIMLKANQLNTTPEAFIKEIYKEHLKDTEDFLISYDNYYTTHSAENKQLCNEFFKRIKEKGDLEIRSIEQAFDPEKNMFLPDRYVKGNCPRCDAMDQYGDSCEKCGSTYSPTDLKNPISIISGVKPIQKSTTHLFFKLGNYQDDLLNWSQSNHLQSEVTNKLKEWFTVGLKSWDITRDAPYFGFEIPGEKDKYFYVWLDAPIGYLASLKHFSNNQKTFTLEEVWSNDSNFEIYHFIGKDIIYFHALFWPAILMSAGYKKPNAIFAHGFLTIDGQKMSKSRGTFITARSFLKHFNPEHLRYYFAAKLTSKVEDIDFNFEDFQNKVNSDLVGKYVNIASRCGSFIHKYSNSRLANKLAHPELYESFSLKSSLISEYYENREFSRVVRAIIEMADQVNQYIDTHKPWQAIKANHFEEVQGVCTTALNLFRLLTIYLKPILPNITKDAELFLNIESLNWQDIDKPLLDHTLNPFKPLTQRVESEKIMTIKNEFDTKPTENPETLPLVTIEDFAKLDLRIARILSAEHIEGADSLLKLQIDLGYEKRQIFAGIKKAYKPEELEGKLTLVIANLTPRKMRFGVSEGMLLVASRPDGNALYLLHPDSGAEPGMRVK